MLPIIGTVDGGLWSLHLMRTGYHENRHAIGLLQNEQAIALFIQHVKRHVSGAGHGQVFCTFHQGILNAAQNTQDARSHRPHHATPLALWAGVESSFDQAWTQALTRHFQKTEMTDATDLNTGAIIFQRFLDAPFNRTIVAVFFHVDEVDDNQSGKVAQTQLAANFITGL